MGKLLRFEGRRLFHKKSFFVCIIILLAYIGLTVGVSKALDVLVDDESENVVISVGTDENEENNVSDEDDLEYDKENLDEEDEEPYEEAKNDDEESREEAKEEADEDSYINADEEGGAESNKDKVNGIFYISLHGIIMMLTAIFVCIYSCEDYVSGTIKNIIAKGYSRTAYTASKCIMIIFAIMCFAVVSLGASFLFGLIAYGVTPTITSDNVVALLCEILVLLAMASVYCAVSALFRSTGPSIAICLVGDSIVLVLLSMAGIALNKLLDIECDLNSYWVTNLMTKIDGGIIASGDIPKVIIPAVLYLIAGGVFAVLATNKKEV